MSDTPLTDAAKFTASVQDSIGRSIPVEVVTVGDAARIERRLSEAQEKIERVERESRFLAQRVEQNQELYLDTLQRAQSAESLCAELRRDGERLDWLAQHAEQGGCPAIINDDNGHWAYSETGIQDIPVGDAPQDIQTSFFVRADEWKPTLRSAIDAAMKQTGGE